MLVTSSSEETTTCKAVSPTWACPRYPGDRSSASRVIAVINSMVAGALVGITLDIFAPRTIALIAGGVLALAALTVHFRLGYGRFLRAMENFTPQFPSGSM